MLFPRRAVDQELPAEAEAESWLLVYLDMMTLLSVMLVVLLAFAGKAPQPQSEHAPATPLVASGHRISVAGHTDSVPIRNVRYPSNWELSGARAGSVVRYLEANGIPSARLTAVGHADTRPLAENTSREGRSINRRVELTLEKPQP